MRIVPLGGAEEIGASCLFVEMGGKRMVVDCGIRTGARPGDDPLPNLSHLTDLGGVDAILVTHAHLDHCGALPVLHQAYPAAPVYATPATHALVGVMLRDALRIMADRSEREHEVPLYSPEAVATLATRALPVRFCERTPLFGGDVAVTFFPAGHVLGAAMIALEGADGKLLVTGDYSVGAQRTVEGAMAPRFSPDVLVTESTYGDRLHANRRVEERRLAEAVAAVVAGGGRALIPAFALGRAQEVILILQEFQRDGVIPRFPVWIDGMVKNICGVYSAHAESLSRSFRRRMQREGSVFFRSQDGFAPVTAPQREAVASGAPCAIISSSGMLTGGPSLFYARRLAADPRNAILITGYQDEESPGRRLLDLAGAAPEERTLTIDGAITRVECRVEKYSLSAHADSGEMSGLAAQLGARDVVLVHGSEEARGRLSALVGSERRVHLPSAGDSLVFESPRRRSVHPAAGPRVPSMSQGRPVDEDGLRALRDSVQDAGLGNALFSIEDLARRWHGPVCDAPQVEAMRRALAESSRWFTPDRKRPFLFRATRGDELAAAESAPGGPLEQNAALQVVTELFGECADLYRKGAYPERHELVLSFHFPRAARTAYDVRVAELAERTGWKVSLAPEEHLGALNALVAQVLPASWPTGKAPSFHREENLVRVRAHIPGGTPRADIEAVERTFMERTGVRLEIGAPPPGTALTAAPQAAGVPMEINLAYATIERVLGASGAVLRKRGKKTDGATGEAYIELTFISPQVGARFEEAVQEAARATAWSLRVNPEPDQNAIKERARALMPAAWGLAREPGFFKPQRCVRARLRSVPAPEELEKVSRQLEEATGYRLEVEPA